MVPCAFESAEWRRALRILDDLERRIHAARPTDDPEALRERFERAMSHRCLQIAREAPWPTFSSTVSVRSWWDRGGDAWLHSLWRTDRIVVPPQDIDTLTRESTAADHPLRPLLCSAGDRACGRETLGWRRRAEMAFSLHDAFERAQSDVAARRRECGRRALRQSHSEPYHDWWRCIQSTRESRGALPHGFFRAPRDGWFVVRGNRAFLDCSELDAYDLETGAAYVVRTCEPEREDRDDGEPVEPVRLAQPTLVTGRVPIDALREAAWMIMLAEHVGWISLWADEVEVPRDIVRRVRREPSISHRFSMWGLLGCGSSHSSTLEWGWLRRGRIQASGTIDNGGCDPGEAHAYDLLEIAEAAMIEGCAPRAFDGALGVWDRASMYAAAPDPLLERLVREAAARRPCLAR